jgi:hypothetical protein
MTYGPGDPDYEYDRWRQRQLDDGGSMSDEERMARYRAALAAIVSAYKMAQQDGHARIPSYLMAACVNAQLLHAATEPAHA